MYLRVAGAACLNVTTSLYILDHIRKQDYVRVEPLRMTFATFSWTIGPSLGVWLYTRYGVWAPHALTAACAVCTSSGTVGPSLSYGRADAAVAVARDAALADAAATALGNRVRGPADLEAAVDWAASLPGVEGAVAILGDRLAVRGDLELVPTPSPPRLSEHWRSPWKPHATSC